MKLIHFDYNNTRYWGILSDDENSINTSLEATSNMKDFNEVITFFNQPNLMTLLNTSIDLIEVTLCAPVIPTKNVLCIGKNYHDHILEFDGSADDIQRVTENPIFFSKALSSIIGSGDAIKLHENVATEIDYEAELAVIIGKTCLNITANEALDYIYGYTCLNDVTSRDLQRTHQQWMKGKSLDTHCPIGPWVVTKDEIQDPQNLKIQSIINGEIRQNASTSLMIHNIAAQIEVLSKGMTLNPGDVIATGTPQGVGMGFKPPKLLKAGDTVEVFIEGIGTLMNKVES
jgi:2-keto-4-pentenoate hydratase/2-oxohepta-3-ene-1,7-dioic acid hydratase in catechol pathway